MMKAWAELVLVGGAHALRMWQEEDGQSKNVILFSIENVMKNMKVVYASSYYCIFSNQIEEEKTQSRVTNFGRS